MIKELVRPLLNTFALLFTVLFALFLAFVITCIGAGGVLAAYEVAKAIFPNPDSFIYSETLQALVFLFFILYFLVSYYKLITNICPLVYAWLKEEN